MKCTKCREDSDQIAICIESEKYKIAFCIDCWEKEPHSGVDSIKTAYLQAAHRAGKEKLKGEEIGLVCGLYLDLKGLT